MSQKDTTQHVTTHHVTTQHVTTHHVTTQHNMSQHDILDPNRPVLCTMPLSSTLSLSVPTSLWMTANLT